MAAASTAWRGDYSFLLQNLILKDFKIRYRNMSLGVLWSLINPLVMMGVMTFVLRRVIGGDDANKTPFPLFVLSGLVPFNFFTGAFLSGTSSIVENAGLIKRVPVPRAVIPVTAVLSNCVHVGIQIALLLVMTLAWGILSPEASPIRPGMHWLWLPVVWILHIAFVCGLALGASAINVFIRDTRYVVESINLVLFWLVPIFYSFNNIPEKYREIYRFNPLAALVMAMRNILFEGIPPAMSLVRNLVIAAVVTVAIGAFVFSRLKSRFYEHI